MKKRRRKITLGGIMVGAAIVISAYLIMIFTISGILQIRDHMDPKPYLPDQETVHYNIINRNYYLALDNVLRLEAADVELKESTKECAAVARYYDAALLRRAFTRTGNEKRAAVQEKRMQEYASLAGSMSEHLEVIDALLEQY